MRGHWFSFSSLLLSFWLFGIGVFSHTVHASFMPAFFLSFPWSEDLPILGFQNFSRRLFYIMSFDRFCSNSKAGNKTKLADIYRYCTQNSHIWKEFAFFLQISKYHCFNNLPETNSQFAPEKRWLEDDRFLFGWPICRCELLVSGSAMECIHLKKFQGASC